MKKTKNIIWIVSFLAIAIIGCNKDDDNNNNDNDDDNVSVTKYNCVSGTCTEDENGQYSSLQDCEANCSNTSGGAYDCVSGNCEESTNGQYTTLADCESNCSSETNDTTLTISGTVYDLVTIGTQVWMAENLNVETSGVCYDETQDCDQYGRLYTSGQAESLCPDGWRIPTKADFETLITELGGATVAGGKLKSTILWDSPNTGATNESGFNALPSGYGINPNDFGGGPIIGPPEPNEYQDQGSTTSFWTSTPTSAGSSDYDIFTIRNNSAGILEEIGFGPGEYRSCRCVKE